MPSKPIVHEGDIILPPYSKWWMAVILFSAVSAISSFVMYPGYHSGYQNEVIVTGVLFSALSVALVYALNKRDEKMLRWTGTLEFVLLVLPLMLFDTSSPFLPYAMSNVFFITFPVLWVLLPIALLEITKSPLKRARFMKELIVLTTIIAISWVLAPTFNYESCSYYTYDGYYDYIGSGCQSVFAWSGYLMMLGLLLAPLAIWLLEYRHMTRMEHPSHPLRGIYGHVEKNLPEIVLIFAVAILFLIGFAIKPSYDYYDYGYGGLCGDGICDPDYEDYISCPEDCAVCGDGYCSYYESYGSCPQDCDSSVRDVRVYIAGGLMCTDIEVRLLDGERNLLNTQVSNNREFTFYNVDSSDVYAEVSSPQNAKAPLTSPSLDAYGDVIRIVLPDDYCDVFPDDGPPPLPETTGEALLSVTVIDAQTGTPLSARVGIFDSLGQLIVTEATDGPHNFYLPEGQYNVSVSSEGYPSFLETVSLLPDETYSLMAALGESSGPPDA
jgi:hypothetical protein